MNLNIGVIKGDGIGPEIVAEAMKVLDQVAKIYGHTCDYTQLLMGGASIDVHGVPLTDETVAAAKSCDGGQRNHQYLLWWLQQWLQGRFLFF